MIRATAALTVVVQSDDPVADRAFMAVSDTGAGEGVYTVQGPNGERLPIIAMDEKGLAILRDFAQEAANSSGQTVRIICFTQRSLHETLHPVTTGGET